MVLAAVVGAILVPENAQGGDGLDAPPAHPEYDPNRLDPQRVPATGSILAELDTKGEKNKDILIDMAHENRVKREELQPLVGALVNRGHEVRFLTKDEDIGGDLRAADAFIVIDPGKRYQQSEVDRVETFVSNGGRLLIFGEPNRKNVEVGFGLSVSEERSQLTTITGRFGFAIGTTYLHNMEHYDGTHEQVFVHAPADGGMAGIDRAVFDTAAPVSAPEGEVLLRTAARTNRSGVDDPGRYPVAVRDGNVTVVGDTTFLEPQMVHVADNEAVAAGLVRFLVSGNKRRPASPTPTPTKNGTAVGSGTGGGSNMTATTTTSVPTPPPTRTPQDDNYGNTLEKE